MNIDAAQTVNEGAITHVNESLKWLVGSAGAAAAFLVAGVQLQSPELDGGGAVVYAIAVVLAVGSALAVLFGAARVLCAERLPAAAIAQREFKSNRLAGKPLIEDDSDEVVTWVQDERGPSLLGTAMSVTELVQRTQRGTPEEKAEAFARLGLIEGALHLRRVQTAFRKLIGWAIAASVVLVASLAVLVALPSVATPPGVVNVDAPIPVDVLVVNEAAADIPEECGTKFEGVAVGGTLDNPRLVIAESADCGPMELEDASGLVVIPQ